MFFNDLTVINDVTLSDDIVLVLSTHIERCDTISRNQMTDKMIEQDKI